MTIVSALVAGLLFGFGLLLSGMANPAVVQSFLDVAGNWNPALAFTMGGAILAAAPAFYLVRCKSRTLLGTTVEPPQRTRLDAPLVAGSAIFGIGWGLSGICPGPGLLLLATGTAQAFTFVGAVIVGTLLAPFVSARR